MTKNRNLSLETTPTSPRRLRFLFALATFALASTACGDDDSNTNNGADAAVVETSTIVDIAVGNPDFSTLVAALDKAGLVETLAGEGPFTVFAPNNAAFAASGITNLDDFSAEELKTILLYHVISNERIDSASIAAGPVDTAAELSAFLSTASGVELNGGNTQTGGAKVEAPDVDADNGIIHIIDRVLLPPDIPTCATYGGLTDLVGAVGAASDLGDGTSVLETLQSAGPFTVFAPTNDAFGAITVPSDPDAVRDILLYHVLGTSVLSSEVPGQADSLLKNEWGNGVSWLFDTTSGVTVNGTDVVVADIKCTNGTVHVVDEVLLPPNVVDMAVIAGFTDLVGAVTTASDFSEGLSMAGALSAQAPYTVFAPTNTAFAAIDVPTDPDVLRDVLKLHVVQAAAPVLSTGLPASADSLLANESLTFNASAPSVTSDGTAEAGIVLTDINVTNGVIHVIDAVLLP